MTEGACPFCDVAADRCFYQGERVVGLWDAFPVSDGHALPVVLVTNTVSTEKAAAPAGQGATTRNSSAISRRSNAAMRDAAAFECHRIRVHDH